MLSRLQERFAPNHNNNQPRRGVVTVWIVLAGPAFLALLIFVLEVAHIWLARVELENALGATALAAVKEWGDAGGGDTLCPRDVGVTYAAANTLVGESLFISNNYNSNNPNGNDLCSGNLIFGAILTENPSDPPYLFDASKEPSCSAFGQILFDATGDGNLNAENAWGISFVASDDDFTNQNLLITKIIIDVDPNDIKEAFFDGVAVLSDDSPDSTRAVQDNDESQPDNFGWARTPPYVADQVLPNLLPDDQISFSFANSPVTGLTDQLIFTFGPDAGPVDAGFSPGDRFRFGAGVQFKFKNGMHQQAGGDEVIGTKITVFFSISGVPVTETAEGFIVESGGRQNDSSCSNGTIFTDFIGNEHLIVHEDGIIDLPCPPNASIQIDKNGQSRALINGGGSGVRPFAVRAQGTIQVKSLFCELCGITLGPFFVTAKETAVYDCETRCPRLIKINPENFYCPGPAPPLP